MRIEEAKGAVNAIGRYGTAQRFADLGRWGARLIALAEDPRFVADWEVRVHEAMGARNAIIRYGEAQRFDDVERWGARIVALAEDSRFVDDPKIWAQIAKASRNAVVVLGQAGFDWEPRRLQYYALLALAARRFPGEATVQAAANGFDLTYAAQAARGWPYGEP